MTRANKSLELMRRMPDGFVLRVEAAAKACLDHQPLSRVGVLMTPSALMAGENEDYWLLRIPVSESQALLCFPKFETCIGIGFQKEEDWNTNLPWQTPTRILWRHIKCNKGDESVPDARCIAAITLMKKTLRKLTGQPMTEQ